MAITEHIEMFKKGARAWNEWRDANPKLHIDLSSIDFESDVHTYTHTYDIPEFTDYNLSDVNLNHVSARNAIFTNCSFIRSILTFSDFCHTVFDGCNFEEAGLAVSKIGSAEFMRCNFKGADLSYCSAEDTKFTGSEFMHTNLSNMSLVKTDFTSTIIHHSRVYGISAWDLILDECKQSNIYIEKRDTTITVPSIEMAQFISLLVTNSKIRDVIDTITSKVVLILGRFTEERKAILDAIKEEIEKKDYVPIIFDFDGPSSRDVTETVVTLALLARFVVVDLSNSKSVPQELMAIVPNFPSVPVQPVIEKNQIEYGMFEHFKKYPWVLEKLNYSKGQIHSLVDDIINGCEGYLDH